MDEVLLVTSVKEGGGVGVVDVRNGSSVCSTFKNCMAEAGTICALGPASSYSGVGSSGDYIAVAQSRKPAIHIWQWGKPSVHLTCHVQEIISAMAVDPSGSFLLAGSQKGWIYCWELSTGELLNTFQAHFKAVTRICVAALGSLCLSASEDGSARVWEMHRILDATETRSLTAKNSVTPYRAWSPHTLPIRDCVLLGLASTRAATVSLDRTGTHLFYLTYILYTLLLHILH
jgi:WD40 repeat protein